MGTTIVGSRTQQGGPVAGARWVQGSVARAGVQEVSRGQTVQDSISYSKECGLGSKFDEELQEDMKPRVN